MRVCLFFIVLVIVSSFEIDDDCLNGLLLNIKYNKSNEKLYNRVSNSNDFKCLTSKDDFKRTNEFRANFISKNCIFKNKDSILLVISNYVSESIEGIENKVRAKNIRIDVFYPDSISMINDYNYIINEYCKSMKFEDEIPVYEYTNTNIIGYSKYVYLDKKDNTMLSIGAIFGRQFYKAPYINISYESKE